MKKKLIIGGLGLALAFGGFFVGSKVGASGDWKTSVINDANSQLGQTGYDKTQELVNDPNAISNSINDALQPEIKTQQDDLEKLLEQYYQMKLQGLQGTPEYKQLEQQISTIKQAIFERFKVEIDNAFKGQ